MLLQKPCTKDLLLFIAQRKVGALDVNPILDGSLLACPRGNRAKTYKEPNPILIVGREVKECLKAAHDLTDKGPNVAFVELSGEIHCSGVFEIKVNQERLLACRFCCLVSLDKAHRASLVDKEVFMEQVKELLIILVRNRPFSLCKRVRAGHGCTFLATPPAAEELKERMFVIDLICRRHG